MAVYTFEYVLTASLDPVDTSQIFMGVYDNKNTLELYTSATPVLFSSFVRGN